MLYRTWAAKLVLIVSESTRNQYGTIEDLSTLIGLSSVKLVAVVYENTI